MCMLIAPVMAADNVTLIARSATDFARPHDLVLGPNGKHLYVADLGNDEVKVLAAESLQMLGSIGGEDLSQPHDVAFDKQGRLLVADTGNSRVAIYQLDGLRGKLVGEYREGLNWTEGVAVANDGTGYATSVGNSQVVRIRPANAVLKAGGSGNGPGQYVRPHDIGIYGDRIYVADAGNNRIQILDKDLRSQASLTAGFKEPKYFDLDKHGWLYVADQHNNVIKVFDSDRKLVMQFGKGDLNLPEGVEVLGERIWISDTYNNRILLYRWPRG